MKPVIIIAIAVVLFVPISAYAIDYRDSTGYTPSWAIGQGYHSVLLKCTEMIGDYSRDGNWCLEWTAYVLDQGIENFPESTQGTSSTSNVNPLSERICTENKICAFPGEYLKYLNSDTYDGFEEIAIIEFKEKINDNTIRVFIDGFGSKPLTYNLNLKTGIETHNEYKNVNRPFNLLEPIPMKIGQKVSQYMEGYFESTILEEKTVNLKDLGLMDVTRVLMMAKTDLGSGDSVIRVYDKETGVLITNVESYGFEGKRYTAGFVLMDTNMFSAPTKILSSTGTSIQNNEKSLTTETKSNKIVSGEYLENISIKTENNDYTITANIGQNPLQVSSIRIIAENECPFKKQIFQKDFLYSSGTEVSFSFYQLSQSKPSECAIHFTISTFEGQVLETIIADYYIEKPTTTNKVETTSTQDPKLASIPSQEVLKKEKIPEWVKNTMQWYLDGVISEDEMISAIQFLVKEGIIKVD